MSGMGWKNARPAPRLYSTHDVFDGGHAKQKQRTTKQSKGRHQSKANEKEVWERQSLRDWLWVRCCFVVVVVDDGAC